MGFFILLLLMWWWVFFFIGAAIDPWSPAAGAAPGAGAAWSVCARAARGANAIATLTPIAAIFFSIFVSP